MDGKKHEAFVLTLPVFDDTVYTVQLKNGSIHQIDEANIEREAVTTNNPNKLPQWIQYNAPITAYLPNMQKQQRRRLIQQYDKWFFRPGYKDTNPLQEIQQFST